MPRFGFSGLCLLVGVVTFAIQQGCSVTGTPPSWQWGAVWFFIATLLVVLAIWFWGSEREFVETPNWRALGRLTPPGIFSA